MAQLKVSPDSVVCSNTELKGDVTVGSKTVIHPKAQILAEDGPIIIGEGNLIEEKVVIINRTIPGEEPGQPLVIGDYNVFEVWSVCEGKSIGNQNVLEAKARLGPHANLTNGCVIGAKCEIDSQETLPENTLICASIAAVGLFEKIATQLPLPAKASIMNIDVAGYVC